jgi:hypothetical protein
MLIKQIDLTYINAIIRRLERSERVSGIGRCRLAAGRFACCRAAQSVMDGMACSGAGSQRGRRHGRSAEGEKGEARSRGRGNRIDGSKSADHVRASAGLIVFPMDQTALYLQLTWGWAPWG